jgi:acyl-CoA reductase-like NAD-dependent aldehyde dehydrogenase
VSDETRELEELMGEWQARRVTEVYRRETFSAQRDETLARWRARGPHTSVEEDFVAFRLARGAMALGEILELEERSDLAYDACRAALDHWAQLSTKERRSILARVGDTSRDTSRDALRVDMRYRHTLVTTLQNEVRELCDYVDE